MSVAGCDPSTGAVASRASDYDLLPYPSLPFAYTQPAHMAAMATLFGLEAPPPDHARVLELGCASGGNIIPLAARFPACHFVGVDLSARQIRDGLDRIATLGLSNIELLQADLARIDLAGQCFDYVICHGLFSWVPGSVQEAILRICRDVLAPNGIAAISYNVLPGWHMRGVIRHICLSSAGDAGSPRERVARARRALEGLADQASEHGPYGQLLRGEAKRLARLPDAYVLGEFLSAYNEPCTFSEFMNRAGSYGLYYVCEADLASSCSESLFAHTRAYLQAAGGSDRIATEQAKDFLTGRPFRRSLLTKVESSSIAARPDPSRLRRLYFSAQLTRENRSAPDDLMTFRDRLGRAIRPKTAAVGSALARLADAFPATLSLEQLTPTTGSRAGSQEEVVCKALYAMAAAGQATISALPVVVANAVAERPCVWSVARVEAGTQPWITTLRHEAFASSDLTSFLCPLLDGSNDREALKERIMEGTRLGKLRLADWSSQSRDQLAATAAEVLEVALADLAHNGLLVPSDDPGSGRSGSRPEAG